MTTLLYVEAMPGHEVHVGRACSKTLASRFHYRKVVKMTTVIAVHDVDDVAHWLSSPKRAEFFGAHGMTVRTFVSPDGKNRVGLIIENVPSLEALSQALEGADAAEAMKYDGVHPDTVELFVAS
ncbi:hypothetical protein [Aromatoleum diolicum]|nr:hypothetical protein [Aromatoleum diolicum]